MATLCEYSLMGLRLINVCACDTVKRLVYSCPPIAQIIFRLLLKATKEQFFSLTAKILPVSLWELHDFFTAVRNDASFPRNVAKLEKFQLSGRSKIRK